MSGLTSEDGGRGLSRYCGRITVSITWITPLVATTSAATTLALLTVTLAAAVMIRLLDQAIAFLESLPPELAPVDKMRGL